MSGGLVALAGRLERHRSLLALAKLGNVGLAMIWGFVITFVFVRLLPLGEFRTFLLLVAFANFTVSAELGFSTVIYSRLRRARVGGGEDGAFRSEELGVLFLFMAGLILLGALLLALGLLGGIIRTAFPALFLAFYAASALNILALLCRRALAALDHNLFWEAVDMLRRLVSVALLFAALAGLPILLAVVAQLLLALLAIGIGLAIVQRDLAMPMRHWWALRAGGAHVRAFYLADIGRTGALTLSDIAAYNAPYFTIVAATHDPRPLLLFDFVFKVSRALTALVRALVETLLPDLTRHFFAGETAAFRAALARLQGLSLALAAGLGALLLLAGGEMSRVMFDGKFVLQTTEITWIVALMIGLALICVSVYVHNGLGRFGALLPPSFAFLAGSLLSVPVAGLRGGNFALHFVAIYALVHLLAAFAHGAMLLRIGRKPAR
jgi:hypothetical protein